MQFRKAYRVLAFGCALVLAAVISVPSRAAEQEAATADAPAIDIGDFDKAGFKLLSKAERIAVPGFRVVFVTRNKTRAKAGSALSNIGNSTASVFGTKTITQGKTASLEIMLAGVDYERMQQITDKAYADFIAQLKASGREVLTVEQLRDTEGFKKLEPAEAKPYIKEPSLTDPRGYVAVAPTGVPLWFSSYDTVIGDKGPFSQGNNKAMFSISVDNKVVVVVPQFVIDFAKLSSSGSSLLKSDAEVSSEKGMTLVGGGLVNSGFNVIHAKISFAGDWGFSMLKKPLALDGDYGEIRSLTADNDAALQNSLTQLTGLKGTQHFKESQALVADAGKYEALALKAMQAANGSFAKAMAEFR